MSSTGGILRVAILISTRIQLFQVVVRRGNIIGSNLNTLLQSSFSPLFRLQQMALGVRGSDKVAGARF
jgi:hypothetical protein